MFGALHTIAVSLLLLSSQALALSYYISSSCNSFPAMNRALAEAFTMAKVSSQRLANQPPDPDIENAFRRIFNTPTANNQARSEVFRIMSGIVGMTPERVRERANVRIYCDEDSRWQLQEDREPIPSILYEAGDETRLYQNGHLIPNSRRGPDDQVWVDRANGMLYRGEIGCDHKAAEMYPEANRAYDGVQIRDRVTFTFCSPFTEQGTPTVADLIDQGVDLGTQILGYPPLDGLLSLTVMHELTHIPAFDTEDVDDAYLWTNVIAKSTADALKNAENYAFFGLTAVLGLAGYCLNPQSQHPQRGELMMAPYVWFQGQQYGREVLPSLGYTAYL